MGFFSLPLARLVGPRGQVVCVDLQQRMLTRLERRARRQALDGVIQTRLCTQDTLGLDDLKGCADLVLAVHVVHETSQPRRFLRDSSAALRPAGHLLIAEPWGHVSVEDFAATRQLALDCGLKEREHPSLRRSHVALFARPAG
jgi:2-polyprenyl-3-methyl-5-hydroxy-6-metoxy-1,4-benzoquinol methylase